MIVANFNLIFTKFMDSRGGLLLGHLHCSDQILRGRLLFTRHLIDRRDQCLIVRRGNRVRLPNIPAPRPSLEPVLIPPPPYTSDLRPTTYHHPPFPGPFRSLFCIVANSEIKVDFKARRRRG